MKVNTRKKPIKKRPAVKAAKSTAMGPSLRFFSEGTLLNRLQDHPAALCALGLRATPFDADNLNKLMQRVREFGDLARNGENPEAVPLMQGNGNIVLSDAVNHPKHYNSHPSGIECIEIVRHMNFNLGNVVKYLWRADHKEVPIQDLEKAAFYLRDEIATRKAAIDRKDKEQTSEPSENSHDA